MILISLFFFFLSLVFAFLVWITDKIWQVQA
jgi:hypothetical protein